MDIDTTFKVSGGPGDTGSSGHLVRLQKWFYFGFKRCYNLSNQNIYSVWQKLPINWEKYLEDLQRWVEYNQVPHMLDMGDGEMEQVPGIDDEDW